MIELEITEKIQITKNRLYFWEGILKDLESFNKQISESGNLYKINMNTRKMENTRNIIDFLKQELASLHNNSLWYNIKEEIYATRINQ